MKNNSIATNEQRKDVIRRELAWHEEEAHRRYTLDALLYDPPAFDPVVKRGFSFLQPATGERILDIGCGEGKETLALARKNLCVISIDLSFTQLQRVRQLIYEKHPSANVHFIQANAEELPFAADAFRIIYGKAILHHLDLGLAARQIQRLLQPAGRASFAEPLAHHPIIWLGRRLTPKLRTQDEHPLTFQELDNFAHAFAQAKTAVFFLLAPLAYGLRLLPGGERSFRWFHYNLQKVDSWLLTKYPVLNRLTWYGVVNVTNPE